MRILICDDEKCLCSRLNSYVTEYMEKNTSIDYEIVEYYSGEDLLEDQGVKDLVFLDIEMPGYNGIYVGNELTEKYPKIIIIMVTSYDCYLDDAMRFSVFRYLDKPVNKERLFRNLDDALKMYSIRNQYIRFEDNGRCVELNTDDIIMIESSRRKNYIITSKETYEVTGTLKEWYDRLNTKIFYMSHRNYIVNIKYITKIENDTVILCGGEYKAYLARRKYGEIRDRFFLYHCEY